MEIPALKDPGIAPTTKVLETALGRSFAAYKELMDTVTRNYELIPHWNHYNDGKAWLCKVQYKKKTIFWLSVWDKHFKVAFYFTEKSCKAINEMDIDNAIKKDFAEHKPIGKLLPLIVVLTKKQSLKDVLKLVEYKKSLK